MTNTAINLSKLSPSGLKNAVGKWKQHYQDRLGRCTIHSGNHPVPNYYLKSSLLKEDNYPQLYYHGRPTEHVLVMTHGLSDSPWYVHFIAHAFFKSGVNVLMPLLPGHGLIHPDKAMEDSKLSDKWRHEMDVAVDIAQYLGKIISLGGFSTGGALSYNKILRDPDHIQGGLFLFSGALNIGNFNQLLSRSSLVAAMIKISDGVIEGIGPDPYKYGTFPKYGGVELSEIDNENEELENRKVISNPVFAAHSISDQTAKVSGIMNLLKKHTALGTGYIVSQKVKHAEMPLQKDVPVDMSLAAKGYVPPKANPQFDEMMAEAIRFFRKHVSS